MPLYRQIPLCCAERARRDGTARPHTIGSSVDPRAYGSSSRRGSLHATSTAMAGGALSDSGGRQRQCARLPSRHSIERSWFLERAAGAERDALEWSFRDADVDASLRSEALIDTG